MKFWLIVIINCTYIKKKTGRLGPDTLRLSRVGLMFNGMFKHKVLTCMLEEDLANTRLSVFMLPT